MKDSKVSATAYLILKRIYVTSRPLNYLDLARAGYCSVKSVYRALHCLADLEYIVWYEFSRERPYVVLPKGQEEIERHEGQH